MHHSASLLDNGDYSCLAELRPSPGSGPDHHHLCISSRWRGARQPNESQTKLSIHLDRQGLLELRRLIDAQLQG